MQFNVETSARADDVGARESDGSTRDRVLQLVVEKGPISAAQLGKELDLTAAAVRRHLDAMTEQGIVEVKTVSGSRHGAGRPSRRYVISSRGQQILGDDYLSLIHAALAVLRGRSEQTDEETESTEAARSVAKQYFSQFEQRWTHLLKSTEDLDDRTEKLAELFSEQGFAGFTRLVGRDSSLLAMQSTQLCQGHCPIREIAAAHPVFCEEETMMIARLLDVDVRRLSTQAAGAHVCTTHVPVGREKLAAERRAQVQHGDMNSLAAHHVGRKRIVISPRQQERLS